ncbi:MAG: nucleoside deaminase [Nanoarchaeota archaeon]
MKHPDEKTMRALIAYTKKNSKGKDNSSGCLIVKGDKILSRGISRVGIEKDPTSHGEMNAVRKICRKQKNYHLHGCWVYSTQIPCPMCTSVIVWAEAKGIVWGWDGRHTWGKLNIDPETILKTAKGKIEIFGHFLEEECLKIKGNNKF